MKTSRQDITPYITKDHSEIRELLHPNLHPLRNLSLAEAVIAPGACTQRHLHHLTEEIYHVIRGHGLMTLGEARFSIAVGDSILIKPGIAHCVTNTDAEPLHILCSCAPAYSHEDTELLAPTSPE